MSVVGIDFGNESCFIAVARAGGIETIDNDYSLRATPSFVAFGDRSRSLGVAAKNQAVTNLKNTISGFKRLLGRPFHDPIVQKMIPNLPFEIVATPSGGLGIRVRYLDEVNVFSPEQITGMLFTKLKETAEHAVGSKVTDCVISVPSYFTDCERRALLDSAKIAGLNVLRLFNETAAAALNYGIYKEDLPEATDPKPRIVAIVDFGHSALQVGITAFYKGKLRILASAQDPYLGGRNFDKKLANYFCVDFKNRFKVDVEGNKRAYLRLLAEVEKLKKQMSANATRLPLNIECLMVETDVSGSLCREQFEEMCSGLFNRVENVLRRCLVESRVDKEDIHSVEVIGGSTRIPYVKGLIERVFGKGVSTTLNQDEAVARGCGLMCALLSPTLKVKDFEVRDVQGYGIKAVWDETLGADGQKVVFEKGCVVPSTRMLGFVRKGALGLNVEYVGEGWGEEGWVPWGTRSIGKWRVEWDGNGQGEPLKLEVKCEMDLNGIFKVDGAQVWEKEDAENMEVQLVGGGGGEDERKGLSQEMETKVGEEKKVELGKVEGGEEKIEGDGGKTLVYKTKNLKVMAITFGLGETELRRKIKWEAEMVRRDEMEKERLDKKNALEEYVYDLREKLEGELSEFVEESEKEGLILILGKFEEWLYDEGHNQEKEAYEAKLDELKGKGEPIKERKMEADGRTKIMRDMDGLLEKGRLLVKMWHNKEPQYAHIPEGEMAKVEKHVKELEGWLEGTRMRFGGDWKKWMVVPVRVEEILAKGRELEEKIKGVLTHPKQKIEEPAVGVEITEEDMPNANSSQQGNGGSKMAGGSQESMEVE